MRDLNDTPAQVFEQAMGLKYDGGKARFSLLDRFRGLLWLVVQVLEFGAAKYKEDSWKDVPDALRRYRDAMDRHWKAIMEGETDDGESKLAHIGHWLCNALFVAWLTYNRTDLLNQYRERHK